MQVAINLGISNAVLETDALQVCQAWSSDLEDLGYGGMKFCDH
jgi:hypothetical protein